MKILIAVIPLLAGFLLDCLLGDPYSLPHPIRLIGRFISTLENGSDADSPHGLFWAAWL